MGGNSKMSSNLVPRVSRGGKMRDPGNEVECRRDKSRLDLCFRETRVQTKENYGTKYFTRRSQAMFTSFYKLIQTNDTFSLRNAPGNKSSCKRIQ